MSVSLGRIADGVAWAMGRASRLTGRGSAGWKRGSSTCERGADTGRNEERWLDTAAQLPVVLSERPPVLGSRRRPASLMEDPAGRSRASRAKTT
jgi:hypothetical protein